MKAHEEAIARLEAERAIFNARIDGKLEILRELVRTQQGSPLIMEQPPERKRARRGDLLNTVLAIAEHVAEKGLTSDECVVLAKQIRGIALIPGSVSSLLSRLKQDGVMFYDGSRYRLKQYAGPRQAA